MWARWLTVLLVAAALVVTPLLVQTRPAGSSDVPAADLVERIAGSARVGWSGLVRSDGTVQIPDDDSFANLTQLFGERNTLRVWWRAADDWRIDRIRSTGETDLYRQGGATIRWVFESDTATISPVSRVRLPDASDLLPASLARSLLQGARPEELARLPVRRVAGLDAPGVRLTPLDPATSIGRVDVWADPSTGLPLRVDLYGRGDTRPVVSTALLSVDLAAPAAETTVFSPSSGSAVAYEESVDVAAAANAAAPYDLPSALAGLPSRAGDPGAVGVYGRGPTRLIALPLRGRVAGPLRARLQENGAARRSSVGTVVPVGPVSLLVTDRLGRGSFLLAGSVTPETLERAAAELLSSGAVR